MNFHLKKLEFATQGCFVPCLVEMDQKVLEKKIFISRLCIFAISLFSPLGKRHDPSFEQTGMPFTQGCNECCTISCSTNFLSHVHRYLFLKICKYMFILFEIVLDKKIRNG